MIKANKGTKKIMVEWEDVDGWLEGYEDENIVQKGNIQMESFVKGRLIYKPRIAVMSDYPASLKICISVGTRTSIAFLNPKEVANLISRLQDWLDKYHTEGVT